MLVRFELLLTGVEFGCVYLLRFFECPEGAGQSASLGLQSRLLRSEGSRPFIEQTGLDLQLSHVGPVQARKLGDLQQPVAGAS